MKRFAAFSIGLLWIGWCAFAVAQSSSPTSPSGAIYTLKVPATPAWTDTNLDLLPGDMVRFGATAGAGNCHPEGEKDGPGSGLALSTALPGALLGKVGAETPFLVGSSKELQVEQPGRLFLGMNAGQTPPCSGELSITLQVEATTPATVKSKLAGAAQTWLSGQLGSGNSASPAAAVPSQATMASTSPASAKLTVAGNAIDSQLGKDLDTLPRRVNDEFKNPGDMVNFVIVGSQEDLQSVLKAAAWQLANQTKAGAVASAILQTYEKQDYLQMPMSMLYLFGRVQDFGYEQAEAYAVVASRHHFRVWKAPFTWNGQPVWVGAGTHDIGFEKDQRNGKVTHKIDPAVDGERDHVGETLQKTGKVKSMNYHLPSSPVREARNATGGSYHSDGRLLVIFLQ
jgi:hypothetical protein